MRFLVDSQWIPKLCAVLNVRIMLIILIGSQIESAGRAVGAVSPESVGYGSRSLEVKWGRLNNTDSIVNDAWSMARRLGARKFQPDRYTAFARVHDQNGAILSFDDLLNHRQA